MPNRIIVPPRIVYTDGSWLIEGIAYARMVEPIGSPSRATDAIDAFIYFKDQL